MNQPPPRASPAPQWLTPLVAFLVPLVVYTLSRPAVPSWDSRKYHELIHSSDDARILPGHLAWVPMMTAVATASGESTPGRPGALVRFNQVVGAATILAFAGTARVLGLGAQAQLLGALGFAFSWGFWKETVEVETYAPSALLFVGSLYWLGRYAVRSSAVDLGWAGLCTGLGALMHLKLGASVTTGVALVWLMRGLGVSSRRTLAVFLVPAVALPAAALGAASYWWLGVRSLPGFLAWLGSSNHGDPLFFDSLSLPRAGYGFVRTFLFLESFSTAERGTIVLKLLGFLAVFGWLAWKALPRLRAAPRPARLVLLASVPFVLLEVLFTLVWFGNDPHFWLFVVALTWLAVSAGLDSAPSGVRGTAALLVLLLAVANYAGGIRPRTLDDSVRRRVLALDRSLPERALVVGPGWDWTDYDLYYTRKARQLSLIELSEAHRGDPAAFFTDLSRRVEEARRSATAVVLVRVPDPEETPSAEPWPTLATRGVSRSALRDWMGAYRWIERRLDDPLATRSYWLAEP